MLPFFKHMFNPSVNAMSTNTAHDDNIHLQSDELRAVVLAWKAACNSPNRRSTLEQVSWSDSPMRVRGWLPAQHQLLYNIVRGLPYDRGFSQVTNPIKIANGQRDNYGLKLAYWELMRIASIADRMLSDHPLPDHYMTRYNDFMKPLNGTVSVQYMADLYKQLK